jgi:hypothetical protein
MPGEKISWDQHIHASAGSDDRVGDRHLASIRKGQEPSKRSYSGGFTGLKNGTQGLDIPPNSITYTEGFTLLKENTIITNFQPHFHLRGKMMQVEAILPDGGTQIISYVANFNFNWMTNYIYADDAAPVFPKGTMIPRQRVLRQHDGATRTTLIRTSGSATATVRSTKWLTRG